MKIPTYALRYIDRSVRNIFTSITFGMRNVINRPVFFPHQPLKQKIGLYR